MENLSSVLGQYTIPLTKTIACEKVPDAMKVSNLMVLLSFSLMKHVIAILLHKIWFLQAKGLKEHRVFYILL